MPNPQGRGYTHYSYGLFSGLQCLRRLWALNRSVRVDSTVSWDRVYVWTRRVLVSIAGLLALVALLGAGFMFRELRKAEIDVDSVPALRDPSKAPLAQPVRYYDADGVALGRRGEQQRVIVSSRAIPHSVRQALVAIEDQRFYSHRGVDFQAIGRAAWVNWREGRVKEGGSTLTMQYIRNVYLDFQQTPQRKLKEAALALQLESKWTKERILTAYLNTVNFGEGAYGVEAAARRYFGIPASRLSLAQSSMLAGVVQAPSAINPRRDLKAAKRRQALVLDEMFAQGMITRAQAERAKRAPLRLRKERNRQGDFEPALVQMLENEVRQRLDERRFQQGGLKVKASFRVKEIRRARRILRDNYAQIKPSSRPVVAAAFVEPRSGRIRILAHNRSPRSYFDYASQSRRQPGSTVKTFTAAEYLRQGGQLSDPLSNEPLKVKNGDSSYTIQPTAEAENVFDMLRFSQNAAAWRLYQKVGAGEVLRLERRLGLKGMDKNPAAALGGVRRGTNPLEMAGAFGAIAATGPSAPVHAVTEIDDLLGNKIWGDEKLRRAAKLDAEYSRQLTVGLRKVVDQGFPQLKASLPISRFRPLAGKTGTSEKNADAWFAGYTPQLAGAVWTGFARSRNSLGNLPGGAVWGSTVPAQNFSRLASRLLAGEPVQNFEAPKGIQKVPRVVGVNRDRAQLRLTKRRFVNIVLTPAFSRNSRPGTVLSQEPAPGVWVRPDTPVRVRYATDQRKTPNLIGQPFLDAEKRLGRFAEIQTQFQVSDRTPGYVIAQDPAPGAPLRYKHRLSLTVATQPGPIRWKTKKVPYVPSNSELADLRRQLQQAQQGAVRVPNVQGLSVSDAQQVLISLGLNGRPSGSGNRVASTSPAPGATTAAGSVVTLNTGA